MPDDTEKPIESLYFWLRLAVTVGVILATFRRRLLVSISAQRLRFLKVPTENIADGDFVERPQLEMELLDAISSLDSETVLLYGDRGGGKTSLINHAFRNRTGVITIRITKTTHDETQDEMIEKISSSLHIFHASQPHIFVEDVFAVSPIRDPVIVVSLEARCGGDALEGVVTTAKVISYDNRHKRHPRIVVDISGSRAAIEVGVQLEKRRVIGVRVGHFKTEEAKVYVNERLPSSVTNDLRRDQIVTLVVDTFDCHVLTLKKICKFLQAENISDSSDFGALINQYFAKEKHRAFLGWRAFCQSLEADLKDPFSAERWIQVVRLLLTGPQEANAVIDCMERDSTYTFTERDIGLANADASYQPLSIDPFETTIALSGRVIAAALKDGFRETTV